MKLRDIGAAVGIVVFYDNALDSICIYSSETSLYDSVVGTWVEDDDYYDWTIVFSYGGITVWPWGNGTYSITDNKLYIDFGELQFDCTYSIRVENGDLVLYLTDSSGTLGFVRQIN